MIGIDITSTQNQYKYRGIGAFSKNVIQRMIADIPDEIVLFGFSCDSTLSNFSSANFVEMGKVKDITPLTKSSYLFSLKSLIFEYNTKNQDKITKFFSPFIHSGVPYDKSFETYAYIHDVIQKATGIYSTKSIVHNWIKEKQYTSDWKNLTKAKGIITNSQTSHDLIKKLINIDSKVVYLGIDHSIYNNTYTKNADYIRVKYAIDTPYVLYYGGAERNKNIKFLLDAFITYGKKFNDVSTKLLIIGEGFDEYEAYVKKHEFGNLIKFIGFVDDAEKVNLIVNAECFLHFSKIEGFGISVLENISCGNPCLVSDIPIYRELFSDCCLFADISSCDDAADQLHAILTDETIRSGMIEKGIEISLHYSWNKTYLDILHLIQETNENY